MTYNIKKLILCLAWTLMAAVGAQAQKVNGHVLSSTNQPVADAIVTSPGCTAVRTADDGSFSIEGVKKGAPVTIWHDGFYQRMLYVNDNNIRDLKVFLVEESKTRYNETNVTPFATTQGDPAASDMANINRKDFALGALSIDNALKGEVAGLQVTNKSGMTGEGAFLQLRGVRSLVAENAPLIVINGVPYMPDANLSQIIGGYSRSFFQALNSLDIRNITVLKGAEAAAYGSMGANGVIMIETDQASSSDMNTRISFSAIAGMNWNSKRVPLMKAAEYKNYLSDIGLTYYPNMEAFFADFNFLSDPDANKSYLYQYDTDWQDEIYRNSSTMDYLFRVEGGDNIAKYNISLGYMGDQGTIKNTNSDRYNAQINASVLVSKKFEIRANINTAYLKGQYQEQGLSLETNPLLAAYRRAPLLSPYKSDMYGNLINTYASYWFGAIENEDFIVSNPLSLVNTMTGKNRQYDMNLKIQLIYNPVKNLTINGIVGMYYNYNQEEAFIPGINNQDIVPLFDQYGQADNTIRVGTNHTFNMYYNANAAYRLDVGEQHKFNFNAGWQAVTTSYEYDAGFGRNSNNDFYQTLGDAQSLGRYFSGYNNKWNWMNIYAHADWTFQNLVKVGLTASFDGASSVGKDATRMTLYPAADVVLMAKNLAALSTVEWLDKLNLHANITMTGNSRFSSKFGKYYYTSNPYQTISGIVRANVPSTAIKAEKDQTLNFGLEAALLHHRIILGAGYYTTKATDVLISGNRSPILGSSLYYNNEAELQSKGLEFTLAVSPIYTKDFRWTIGGTLSTLDNKVNSLGTLNEIVTTLNDDAQVITRVGENPYAFYGLKSLGVFKTTAEAEAANLTANGQKFQAGDIHYYDANNDGVIDSDDRVVIGSATPDIFGSLFTRFEYKNFALDLTFAFSNGNDAYNAVRRVTESGSDFSNQATSLNRRWLMEGQDTDIPRVRYNDRVGNNAFSDRWIEDASYIKLRDITFSYDWNKPLWNFIQGGTIFVTGQNLFCITDYLGLDPEFSYSYSPLMQGVDYAKATAPRAVKLGVNLRF
ncbi:MAG: SusC/RagA family TonB-linked outer membrane protein [Prevotella sp.]|nr:SusC/RagA family TonB-linked outer membrane protein [Prevotella sp.]